MKVLTIREDFTGDPGPTTKWGEELTVKRIVLDEGERLYQFKEYPGFGYSINGFLILESSLPKKRQFRRKEGGLF
jgi:hypothetical protein